MRGRTGTCEGTKEAAGEKTNDIGEEKEKKGAESTKEIGTSDRVGTSSNGSRVKKTKPTRS